MISLEDCMAMCGLTCDEVAAIAEHEHIPEAAASALANYLLHKNGGHAEIRQMMVEDIRSALAEHKTAHASELFKALRHFLSEHQDALKAKTTL